MSKCATCSPTHMCESEVVVDGSARQLCFLPYQLQLCPFPFLQLPHDIGSSTLANLA